MNITNIESTGFNSLFQASSALARKTIEANVPTQKERALKADNNSLSRDNLSLEAQNKRLEEQNIELENNNRELSRQVKETQTEQFRQPYENSSQQETRSEEKAKAADDVTYTQSTPVNTVPQQIESTSANSYTPTADISGIDLGNTFNSYA